MTYDQKVLNDIVNIMQNVRNDQAMPAAAAGAGRQTTEQQPRPMSFQEFHQGYQQAKQQAIIAGASSEAARQEHIALMAPKRVANINGVYYPKELPGGNSRLMQVGQGQQRVVLPGQQTFTRLGTGFNTGYKTEAAQQGLSYITEMKNQAKAQYDAYIASPEYMRNMPDRRKETFDWICWMPTAQARRQGWCSRGRIRRKWS